MAASSPVFMKISANITGSGSMHGVILNHYMAHGTGGKVYDTEPFSEGRYVPFPIITT